MSVRMTIGKFARKINSWCMKTCNDLQDTSLNALTPTLLSDEEYALYKSEFSYVFGNPKIRNIALMGSFGAGKSTVMETWNEKQRQAGDDHESTFISLAHFHGSRNETNAVEGEILNQLIHKTKRNRIPKSRFRHTQDDRRVIDLIKAMLYVGYGLLTVFLIALLARDGIVFPDRTELTHPIWIAAWVIGLVVILYSSLRRDKADRLLRRIKVFGNEIELFELSKDQVGKDSSESHDPIFNKYMDDVLYLLNNSGSDVYIFEDIDRFNDSIEIFEKLRELNNLANDCRSKRLKPLRFFYLVREDLFVTPEDRVKFFEFIIPVIPFADPDGNFDELRSRLYNLGLNVSDLFVYEISSFIPDSRTLKDIINEVKHYREHVFRDHNQPLTENEAEHLVALIIYKVVFPADFSNFQRGKGYVAELLKKRDKIVGSKREDLSRERGALKREICEIDEKNHFTLEELALINCGNLSIFDRAISTYGTPVSSKDSSQEMIAVIRENERASALLDEEMDKFSTDGERQKRFGIPGSALESRRNSCLERIHEIDKDLVLLECCTLGDVLSMYDDNGQFSLIKEDLERPADFEDCQIETVQSSPHFPLLKHLLITDLIDTSSIRYSIRVRPEGLSLADQRNLAIIQGRRPIDPAYVFDRPNDVLMRIRDEYLMVPGAQNYSLLKEILDEGEAGKLSKFIAGLQRSEHPSFFLGYVASNQFVPSVFSVIENNFDNEADIVLSNEAISVDKRRNFAHKLMCYEDTWKLKATEDALVGFANADSDLLSADKALLEGVRSNIDKLPLSLSDINFETADEELLNIVYEESLYEPNAALVTKWIEHRFPYYVVDRHSTISSVYSLPDERLHEFVEKNMEIFIHSILNADSSSLSESEDVLVWVLNALSSNQETAASFVARLEDCTVRDLSKVKSKALKRTLLSFDVPEFSGKNVLDYFFSCGYAIDDVLAAFVHSHLVSEESQIATIDALSDSDRFIRASVEEPNLTDKDIRILLSGEGSASLANFNIEGMDQSRVAIVLQAQRIPVTDSNAKFIRDNYSSCESLLAATDIDAYLGLIVDDGVMEFDERVGLRLFELNQIAPSKKVEIAKLFESPIRLKAIYPDLLKSEIIDNHFDIDDLPQLLDEFESGSKQLRESVKNKAVARLEEITLQELAMPCGLFCEVLKVPSLSADSRLEQIAFQLNLDDSLIANRDSARSCFEAAGAQDYVRLIEGKKISVPDDSLNMGVVEALRKRGMCSEKSEQGANGCRTVYPKGYGRN